MKSGRLVACVPVMPLSTVKMPYLDLREIEGLPGAKYKISESPDVKEGVPFNNNFKIIKISGGKGIFKVYQEIEQNDYQAALDYEYSEWNSMKALNKYFDKNEEINILTLTRIEDDRFEILAVNELEDFGCLILAKKDMKIIQIYYSGKLNREFFLNKIDEIFRGEN
jgi:hypothetical protein